jgi:hypothetical protein
MKLKLKDLLEYEVSSYWLSSLININWIRELLASYLLKKTTCKYRRYVSFLQGKEEMLKNK